MKNIFLIVLCCLLFASPAFSTDRPNIRPSVPGQRITSDTQSRTVEDNSESDTVSEAADEENENANGYSIPEKLDSKYPDIPVEWGTLINAESVKDTAYLMMYFMDDEGRIRVAIWQMGKKEVELYKLLLFNRGEKPLIPKKK